MKVAVFSDIHGNFDAFRQVLIDIDENDIDAMFCLGDNVGYGPEPEKVLSVFQQAIIPTVLGNHDLACIDEKILTWFNPVAASSLQKTLKMLSPGSLRFLRGLKTSIVYHGCRFVHGFPPNSPKTYLFQVSKENLRRYMSKMDERICFIGHTHELRIVEYDGEDVRFDLLREGKVALNQNSRYILNIGSVGQPRDGDNRAKYLVWDTKNDTVEVRFIEYDIGLVVEKILAAGLPEAHASRLW
jgi:predicted phosphodiesterase